VVVAVVGGGGERERKREGEVRGRNKTDRGRAKESGMGFTPQRLQIRQLICIVRVSRGGCLRLLCSFLIFPSSRAILLPCLLLRLWGHAFVRRERGGLDGTSSLGLVRFFATFSRASDFENIENATNFHELINKYSNIFFRHCFAVPKVPGTFL